MLHSLSCFDKRPWAIWESRWAPQPKRLASVVRTKWCGCQNQLPLEIAGEDHHLRESRITVGRVTFTREVLFWALWKGRRNHCNCLL